MSFPPYWPGSQQIFQQLEIDGENLSIVPFGNTVQLPTQYSTLSTIVLNANEVNASTIFTYEIFIDNQGLTATSTDLLLNGQPLIVASNLSTTISAWSEYSAIQDVNMDNFNLSNTNTVISQTVSSGQGLFSSINTPFLYANDILVENLTALSSIHSYNYTSSSHIYADDANISTVYTNTIQSSTIQTQLLLTSTIDTNNIIVSTINGSDINQVFSTIVNPASNVSQWANFPAVTDVTMNAHDIKNANVVEFYELNRTSLLGGDIDAGDIQCDNLTVGNTFTNLADVAIYGVNALPGDNALYVEGGTTLTGGGIVHGVTIGALQVGGIDTVRIDVLPAGMGLNSATYIQLAAAGAGSFAAGGALSLAGGDYVEINTGEIQCINTTSGQSWLSVNNVQGNSHNGGDGTLEIHDVTRLEMNSGAITGVSSINGQQLAEIGGSNWATYPAVQQVDMNAQNMSNLNNLFIVDSIAWPPSSGGANITGGQINISLANVDEIDVVYTVAGNGPNARIYNFSTIQGPLCQLDTAEISSIKLNNSTILSASLDLPGLAVRQADDNSIAQVNASGFVVGDPDLPFQGAYSYSITQDRAVVLNSTTQTKYVAYTEDLQNIVNNSVSTVTVETGSLTTGTINAPDASTQITLGPGFSTTSFGNTLFYSPVSGNNFTISYTSTVVSSDLQVGNSISTPELYVSSVNGESPFGNKYIVSANSSNKQTVLGANTMTLLEHDTTLINQGGFTVLGSTITVPVDGIYEIQTSIQFSTASGGTNTVYFWLRKNGSNVDDSASIVSITNNGETLGNITLLDNASANDQYTIAIESADTNMAATSFAASGNVPAIPSVITNIKRIS